MINGWGNIGVTINESETDIPVSSEVPRDDFIKIEGVDKNGHPIPIRLRVDKTLYEDQETYNGFLESVKNITKLPWAMELLQLAEKQKIPVKFQNSGSFQAALKVKSDGSKEIVLNKKMPPTVSTLRLVHEMRHIVNAAPDINQYAPQDRLLTQEVLEADSRLFQSLFAVQMAEKGNTSFLEVQMHHTPGILASLIENRRKTFPDMLTEGLIMGINEGLSSDYKTNFMNYVRYSNEKPLDLNTVVAKITQMPESLKDNKDQVSYSTLKDNTVLKETKALYLTTAEKEIVLNNYDLKMREISISKNLTAEQVTAARNQFIETMNTFPENKKRGISKLRGVDIKTNAIASIAEKSIEKEAALKIINTFLSQIKNNANRSDIRPTTNNRD